jgi:oligoribonuclease NrnB/cAMP/cGMP phosphodiesterase (DHH superfamily)
MEDELIDDSRLPLRRRTLLPGAGFFYPDSLDEERAAERIREAVAGAEAVVVADTDADGLGCVALVREAREATLDVATFEAALEERLAGADERGREAAPEAEAEDGAAPESPVAFVGTGPYSLDEDLEHVVAALEPGADVYVCDVCPDEYDPIADALDDLVARAGEVRWFDHHQWDEDVAAAVREAGADLVVGDSDEECTADVALRAVDHDFPAHLVDLAAVTRDHDLWLREDPRSDDLADYAYWADAEEYVAVVGRYGPDLPDAVHEFLRERRVEKRARIDVAVERATVHEVGPWTVAATYGRCSQNEVAERLREEGADAAVVVKPAGSASIRGSEGFERAHEVAAQVQGGGHPRAAGCKPDIYDDMLDYAQHWTTHGRAAQRVILAAFERVAEDVEGGAEVPDEEDVGVESETAEDAGVDG